jgi:hypothetical protein
MKIDSFLQHLGRGRPQRTAAPRATGQLDEIGPAPPGIAAAPEAPGAQLHDVLAAVQQRVPAATGLMIRDGVLYVAYDGSLDDAARAAVRAAIADRLAGPEKP